MPNNNLSSSLWGNYQNAESYLGILVKEYEDIISQSLIFGWLNKTWTLQDGAIYEMGHSRRNKLSYYDTMAFLIAILQLEERFISNNEEEEFWEVFRDSWFFISTGWPEEYVMNNIVYNIGKEHKKLIPRLLTFSERLYILRELYMSLKSEEAYESDEILQRDILLGMVMIQFLNLWVRPYMLESNKKNRTYMLREWRDWVYELSELFHDFSNGSFYHMGWFGQMYESIRHQALQLQERKEKKTEIIRYMSTVAMEKVLSLHSSASSKQWALIICKQIDNRVKENERIVAHLLRRL